MLLLLCGFLTRIADYICVHRKIDLINLHLTIFIRFSSQIVYSFTNHQK